MIFYHGTNPEAWQAIQEEGVLWGKYPDFGDAGPRFTYLAPYIGDATPHGSIILAVEYEPTGVKGVDNYGFDPPPEEFCWQFAVFLPIEIHHVRTMAPEEVALVKSKGLRLEELRAYARQPPTKRK